MLRKEVSKLQSQCDAAHRRMDDAERALAEELVRMNFSPAGHLMCDSRAPTLSTRHISDKWRTGTGSDLSSSERCAAGVTASGMGLTPFSLPRSSPGESNSGLK